MFTGSSIGMKNGKYVLTRPPEAYTGKRYRGKYCYLHHLVWWEHTGHCLKHGEHIHHINGDPHDNEFSNLRLVTVGEHASIHNKLRSRPFAHGEDRTYTHGRCRCRSCKQAHTVVMRQYRSQL